MTTKQLDALNRKNRIIKRLQAGESHAAIARDERVGRKHVGDIGLEAGLRVSKETRLRHFKETIAKRGTQHGWWLISRALDAYNAAHGRTKAPRREA